MCPFSFQNSIPHYPGLCLFFSASLAFLFSFIIVLGLIRAGVAHDVPNSRSSHKHTTPTLGGIGFAIPILITVLWTQPWIVIIAFVGIMLVGIMDDIYGLSYRSRLLAQGLAAIILIYQLGHIHSPWLLEANSFLSSALALGLTLFTIMGVINGTNFIDGLNGLLAGCVMMAIITWWLVTPALSAVWLVSLASILGYWIMNRQGSIFMGDVGSTFLGLWMAMLLLSLQTVHTEQAMGGLLTQGAVITLAPLMFVWGDVSFTLIHRWKRGETLSQAHRDHFIHRLADNGYSHNQVACLYMLGTLYMGFMTLMYVSGHLHLTAFITSYFIPQVWIARRALLLSKA